MGREIRKVPKGWQHPRDRIGRYQPMFKEYYNDVLEQWQINKRLWDEGKHPDQKDYPEDSRGRSYEQWHGKAPDPRYYNPNKWSADEANCFQVYETVTEGTPISPVFDSLEQVAAWLVKTRGYTPEAAEELCKEGWLPTIIGKIPGNCSLPGLDNIDPTEPLKRPLLFPAKPKRPKRGKQ